MAKRIIALNDYESIRNDYATLIKEWNGTNMVLDNSTPLGFPYLNDNQFKRSNGTYINKQYRDRRYLSFLSASDIHLPISTPTSGKTTITMGLYKIKVIGGGSGGHVTYAAGGNGKGGSECACGMAGACGSYAEVVVYLPFNGDLKYIVGDGGRGEKTLTASNGNWTGSNTQCGQNTEVFFNDIKIISAGGGGYTSYHSRKAKKNKFGGKHKTSHAIDAVSCNNGGIFVNNAYVYKVIEAQDSRFAEQHGGGYTQYCPRNDVKAGIGYGSGGDAQAVHGNASESIANDGTNGYFQIDTYENIGDFDFLNEIIPVESKRIHTLGNDNNIRRCLSSSLNVMYNKLNNYGSFDKEDCYLLGEEYNGTTTAKPFNQLNLEKDPLNVVISDGTLQLSEVKSHRNNGCFQEDDYIVTYDINQKRKLNLEDYKTFEDNEREPYNMYEYNGDIIYVKDASVSPFNVYKYINGKFVVVGSGTYTDDSYSTIFVSETNGESNIEIANNTLVIATLVGAGGGAGGGSWRDRWKTPGAGGGSGGALEVSFPVNNQTIRVIVGKGGNGGTLEKTGGGRGSSGTASQIYIGNTLIASAGAGGGGEGSFKKNNYPPYPMSGSGGLNTYNSNIVSKVSLNKNGLGGNRKSSTAGELSIYNGANYGAGGNAIAKAAGLPGVDGYIKIMVKDNREILYNGHIYNPYSGAYPYASVILNSDREYLIDRLDAIENYLKRERNYFDSDGYCQRTCQINCQTTVQKK